VIAEQPSMGSKRRRRHGHLRHQGLQASCSVQQYQTYRFGPEGVTGAIDLATHHRTSASSSRSAARFHVRKRAGGAPYPPYDVSRRFVQQSTHRACWCSRPVCKRGLTKNAGAWKKLVDIIPANEQAAGLRSLSFVKKLESPFHTIEATEEDI
jgi:hypothetical protein